MVGIDTTPRCIYIKRKKALIVTRYTLLTQHVLIAICHVVHECDYGDQRV